MKRKKLLAKIIVCVIAVSSFTVTAGACTNPIHGGTVNYDVKNLRIGVKSNAINSVLTFNVYDGVRNSGGWNGIHSPNKVNVSMVINLGSSPNATRHIDVEGWWFPSGALGQVIPYDANGNVTGRNNNWATALIQMSNDVNIWGNSSVSATTKTQRARYVFIHELGHIFKLQHTICSNAWAVMRTGDFPSSSNYISATVTDYDKSNIANKW